MQGIILKENGSIGDAERMFIQVRALMVIFSFAFYLCGKQLAKRSCRKIIVLLVLSLCGYDIHLLIDLVTESVMNVYRHVSLHLIMQKHSLTNIQDDCCFCLEF